MEISFHSTQTPDSELLKLLPDPLQNLKLGHIRDNLNVKMKSLDIQHSEIMAKIKCLEVELNAVEEKLNYLATVGTLLGIL